MKKGLGIVELTCIVSSLKPNYVARFDLVFTTRNVLFRPLKTRHFETHFKEYTLVHFVTDNRKIYVAIQGTIDVNNSTKNLFSSALMIKRDEMNPISS